MIVLFNSVNFMFHVKISGANDVRLGEGYPNHFKN